MTKVLVPAKFSSFIEPELKKHNLQSVVLPDQKASTILEQAKDVDALILSSDKVDKSLMEQLPNLKIIARTGVGYNNVDLEGASELGIPVTNTPGANAHTVAENTVNDILTLSKRTYSTANQMRGQDVISDYHKHTIYGKTIGVVGFGNVAKNVIKLLSSFGVRILIWNHHKKESEYGTFVDWDTLVRESDYITLHIPALPATKGIMNSETFKNMKNTAFVINYARGELINEHDLIDAINNGEITGAGLDVFDKEPLPAASPLRKLKNVFLTPHIGLDSEEASQKISLMATQNVVNVLAGKEPLNQVNK
ncbi:phosphoglycerate dehydrogenase [Lactobacillaceae bacterium Melli_B4]